MRITVGIPATRPHTIEAAVRSIRAQTWRDWELLIVGQGSETPARAKSAAGKSGWRALKAAGERLEQSDRRIRYIHLPEMGLSRARNTVLREAQGEVIAYIDDDCEADPDWLAVLADCLQAEPGVGLVGGALVCPPGSRYVFSRCPTIMPPESLYDPTANRGGPEPGWDWVTASVAMRTELVERVGLFDEFLGPGTPFPAGEDRDYKLRLEAMGVCMMTTPRAVVRHTYGRRVGLRAMAQLSRSYARGGGAVAGKLTVSGDPRGAAWVRAARREFWRDLANPTRSVAAIYRMPSFLSAYREVVAGYTIDRATGWLCPRPGY